MTPARETLPKITPYLVDRARDLCPRRLRLTYQGQRGDSGAFLRGRVRDAVVQDARDAHAELGPPRAESFSIRPDLVPEEQALQRRAIDHYLARFGDDPVRAIDHEEYDRPVERRGVLVGGWIDLACEGADGEPELRQFELWGRRLDPDPTSSPQMLLAVLRLSRWIGERAVRIRHADLISGDLAEHEVDLAATRSELVSLYEQRFARITLRIQDAEPTPGEDCTTCPYVPGCPALRS